MYIKPHQLMLLVIFFACSILLLMNGCTDSSSPLTNGPTVAVCQVTIPGNTGIDTVRYSASGPTPSISDGIYGRWLMLSSKTNINGTDYSMLITVNYSDSKDRTGTFAFRKSFSTDTASYAVGYFFVGSKPDEYDSYSGSVTITKISGANVSGYFSFKAMLKGGTTSIDINNGSLNY